MSEQDTIQAWRDVWEKSNDKFKKILYFNLTEKEEVNEYDQYYSRYYRKRNKDIPEDFDYLDKLMSLTSISLFEVDDLGFNYLPKCWGILLENLESLDVFRMYNLKALPFEKLTKLKRLNIPNEWFDNLSELENLTQLEELGIVHLNFNILKLTNLRKLKIKCIRVDDFALFKQMPHLKSLDLTEVTQGHNQETIKALSNAIGKLTQLEELNLTYCYNVNLNCVRNLKRLKKLNISSLYENRLSPILPIAHQLEELDISFNRFKDLHLLSKFKHLKWLNMENSRNERSKFNFKFLRKLRKLAYFKYSEAMIRDLEKTYRPLTSYFNNIRFCKNLKHLYLKCSGIGNVDVLKVCKALEYLILDENEISDITGLSELKYLKEVSLVSCKLRNIEGLKNKPCLTKLDISDNFISDISSLEDSKQLEQLIVDEQNGMKVSDISVLSDKTQLKELHLSEHNITDISPLENLINLTELSLSKNLIDKGDLNFLSNLTQLYYLVISYCGIENIDFISTLTKMNELYLDGNPIQDYTPLLPLKKLRYLSFEDNDIKDYMMFNHKNFPHLELNFLED